VFLTLADIAKATFFVEVARRQQDICTVGVEEFTLESKTVLDPKQIREFDVVTSQIPSPSKFV
jgi:hypothetical protein